MFGTRGVVCSDHKLVFSSCRHGTRSIPAGAGSSRTVASEYADLLESDTLLKSDMVVGNGELLLLFTN